MTDKVKIGPFTFSFLPDGDDPGVGIVEVWYGIDRLTSWSDTALNWKKFTQTACR